MSACPTCGRAEHHWTDRPEGTKAKQLEGCEDRDARYREWHRKLGSRLCAMDVDQVEYRVVDGIPRVRALIELTRIDGAPNPPPSYFGSILDRAEKRDAQITVLTQLAEDLGVRLFYVAYMKDGGAFYVCDLLLDPGREWLRYSANEYRDLLSSL